MEIIANRIFVKSSWMFRVWLQIFTLQVFWPASFTFQVGLQVGAIDSLCLNRNSCLASSFTVVIDISPHILFIKWSRFYSWHETCSFDQTIFGHTIKYKASREKLLVYRTLPTACINRESVEVTRYKNQSNWIYFSRDYTA